MSQNALCCNILCTLLLLITAIVGYGLFFGDYDVHDPFSKSMIQTECSIVDHTVKEHICTEPIDLGYSHDFTCYSGHVVVTFYSTDNNIHVGSILYGDRNDYNNTIESDLKQKFPIGDTITCYYNKHDKTDIELQWTKSYHLSVSSLCYFTGIILTATMWVVSIVWCGTIKTDK